MHPVETTTILEPLVAGGRTWVVSNAPVGGSFARLVKPAVVIGDMTFVGYCTNDILNEKSHDWGGHDGKGGYLRSVRAGCLIKDTGKGWWQRHNERFTTIVQQIRTSTAVVLFHEGRKIVIQHALPLMLKYCPGSVSCKVGATGHDHAHFRPHETSPMSFYDSAISGMHRMFFVPPFGCGMGIWNVRTGTCRTEHFASLQ
jgi:hypothetical protein